MNYKWFGAVMIISGCSIFGLLISIRYRREVRILRTLHQIIDYMICELQYSLTELPNLFDHIAKHQNGVLSRLFRDLRRELDWQQCPDIPSCMYAAIRRNPELPPSVCRILRQLGRSLGQFDLPGQIRELESLIESCKRELSILENRENQQVKICRTLSLCAGTALAILLF